MRVIVKVAASSPFSLFSHAMPGTRVSVDVDKDGDLELTARDRFASVRGSMALGNGSLEIPGWIEEALPGATVLGAWNTYWSAASWVFARDKDGACFVVYEGKRGSWNAHLVGWWFDFGAEDEIVYLGTTWPEGALPELRVSPFGTGWIDGSLPYAEDCVVKSLPRPEGWKPPAEEA